MKREILEQQGGRVLAIKVGDLVPARVVGIGSTNPQLQTREPGGRFRNRAGVDDRNAREHLVEYADLVEWALRGRR